MKCSVMTCRTNTARRPEGISFHRFPKDERRRRLWKTSIGRLDLDIKESTCVCSEHFKDEDLIHLAHKTRISETAIPALNIDLPPSKDKIVVGQPRVEVTTTFNVSQEKKLSIQSNPIHLTENRSMADCIEKSLPVRKIIIMGKEPRVETTSNISQEKKPSEQSNPIHLTENRSMAGCIEKSLPIRKIIIMGKEPRVETTFNVSQEKKPSEQSNPIHLTENRSMVGCIEKRFPARKIIIMGKQPEVETTFNVSQENKRNEQSNPIHLIENRSTADCKEKVSNRDVDYGSTMQLKTELARLRGQLVKKSRIIKTLRQKLRRSDAKINVLQQVITCLQTKT